MSHEFYLTLMGRRFYESTMPELVHQLTRLNDNLERLTAGGAVRAAYAEGRRSVLGDPEDGPDDELAGHDMDRCAKHHMPVKLCPDCGGLPEDRDEEG